MENLMEHLFPYPEDRDEFEKTLMKMEENLELLKNHEIPEAYPDGIGTSQYMLGLIMSEKHITRDRVISLSSFPLISKNWLRILAEYLNGKKCLEIMAGSGMLTKGLRDLGVDIVATDDFSWSEKWKLWTEVERMDCLEAIEKYAKERPYIIMSWPEMGDTASQVLDTMRKCNPDARIIYIGEQGGCCANEDFFQNAILIDQNWSQKINKEFISWCGIHDLVLIMK